MGFWGDVWKGLKNAGGRLRDALFGKKEEPEPRKVRIPKPKAPSPSPTPTPTQPVKIQPAPKETSPVAKETQRPRVANWLVKVPVVLEPEGPNDLSYADYSLWLVVGFDPVEEPKRLGILLQAYRVQLKKKDPRIRWLSDKWRVSRTWLPQSAWTETEPPEPPEFHLPS